jgi:hypothetical protein
MRLIRPALGVLAAAFAAGCGPSGPSEALIFIDGRAVAAAGDTLLAFSRQGSPDVTVRDRRTGAVYARGVNVLSGPHHIQQDAGRWYVSDIEQGRASVAVFSARWELERRIPLEGIASAPHQFAVLPDQRIVVEAPDGRLVGVGPDSVRTFALVEQSSRTGLVMGARGGVLHAVPSHAITLYNERGNIRWRLPWPWHERAYVSDIAEDGQGRIHVLAGEGGEGGRDQFVAFSLSPTTGEVIRWSEPGLSATFVVARLGEYSQDSPERWLRQPED